VWERRVDEADRNVFERADAAKAYGVTTAVGIPFCGGTVDCVVFGHVQRLSSQGRSDRLRHTV
jgi:hypothetical protein